MSVPPNRQPTEGATVPSTAATTNGTAGGSGGGQKLDARQIALLQLCFDETELTMVDDEAFDPATFVKEKCQHVSLSTLAADLKTYSEDIDARVMKHIHDDVHEAFISVSGQLVAIQDSLKSVLIPLDDVRGRVAHAVEGLAKHSGSVDELCGNIKKHEMERLYNSRLLELVLTQHSLDTHLDVVKREAAAQEGELVTVGGEKVAAISPKQNGTPARERNGAASTTSLADSPKDFTKTIAALQRAAADVQQVRSSAAALLPPPGDDAKAESTAAKKQASEHVERFFTALDDTFVATHDAFVKEPSSGNLAALSNVLGIYILLGDETHWCTVYSNRIVRPLAEDVITWKVAGGARSNANESKKLLQTLCARIENDIISALPLLRRELLGVAPGKEPTPGSVAQHISIISDAVWPAVSDTILKRMLFLFAPGIPAAFHSNFVNSQSVVALMEKNCSSLSELAKLRASFGMGVWLRNWNLDVYYALQQNELQQRIKNALAKPLAPGKHEAPALGAGFTFTYEATLDLVAAIHWFFSTDVIIFPLISKFMRDVISQVVGLSGHFQSAASKIGGAEAINICCFSSGDLGTLKRYLEGPWANAIVSALDGDTTLSNTTQQVINIATTLCSQGQEELKSVIERQLVEQCVAQLTHLKSIKAQYNMTKKPMPTAPSWFMKDSVKPIQEFRNQVSQLGVMSQDQVKRLTEEVVASVTEQLKQLTRDVMVSARKAQDAIDKLKRKKGDATATAGAGSNERPTEATATDRDKMVVQLYLDIEEFGSQLRSVGINKESYEPLKEVLKLVQRARWILGADIPMPPEIEEE